jgi:hypothetical protein
MLNNLDCFRKKDIYEVDKKKTAVSDELTWNYKHVAHETTQLINLNEKIHT